MEVGQILEENEYFDLLDKYFPDPPFEADYGGEVVAQRLYALDLEAILKSCVRQIKPKHNVEKMVKLLTSVSCSLRKIASV